MRQSAKYQYGNTWKKHSSVSAVVVGEELDRIIRQNKGIVIPQTVVTHAKPQKSPIHDCFEWDDKKAAKAYRLEQAGHLLRSVTVVIEDTKGRETEVRAFPNIETPEGNYYTTNATVMESLELTEKLESQILRELMYLQDKGRNIKKFRKVWLAINAL